MKKRKLIIDADYLLFEVCQKRDDLTPIEGSESFKSSIKPLKKQLLKKVKMLEDLIAVQILGEFTLDNKPLLVFSDPKSNFRYDLLPEYKGNRKASERSEEFYKLRKWAVKKFLMIKGFEADDVVSALLSNDIEHTLGVSFDKDLIYGVTGKWFNPHYMHKCIVDTNEVEANRFLMMQCIAGDSVDNIKGIPNVGMKSKLLDKYGYTWEGVIKAYEEKGLNKDDATLTRRLVDMYQLRYTKKGKFKFKLFGGE